MAKIMSHKRYVEVFPNTGYSKAMTASEIQSNLDSSNTDGSFTMANSNSFLVPTKFFR